MSGVSVGDARKRLFAGEGGDDLEIFGRELCLEQLYVGEDVVDDEDAGGHASAPA